MAHHQAYGLCGAVNKSYQLEDLNRLLKATRDDKRPRS